MQNLKVSLGSLILGKDGIYSYQFDNNDQTDEVNLRNQVAHFEYKDYLDEIANSHSISVMDKQVSKFIEQLPQNSIIIDVGGCWGWHWRNIDIQKRNIIIVIIDLVRHNLYHAKQVLKSLIDSGNVLLVHGNATELPFPDNTFDGYWTVQTLQHIPNIEKAVKEAHRVLKEKGLFINYTLNNSPFMKLIYKLSRRVYHVDGKIEGRYFLRRSTLKDAQIVSKAFDNEVEITFSEIIFQLEFKTTFSGKIGSLFGRLDSFLTTKNKFAGIFARQISFSTRKKY